MPVYTYTCTSCHTTVEKRQSFSDAPLTTCEACAGTLRKVIHPVGIVFKGSGWYVTDSRASSKVASSTLKKDGESKSESAAPDGESKNDTSASGNASESKSTSTESKPAAPATSSGSSSPSTPAASSAKS